VVLSGIAKGRTHSFTIRNRRSPGADACGRLASFRLLACDNPWPRGGGANALVSMRAGVTRGYKSAAHSARCQIWEGCRMKTLLRSLGAGAVLLSLPAHADTYPSKPITFIVPFGPGSGTDTITRVAAQHLGAALKQSVVVEDRPGANGALAALYVARSAPDGYTLFMSTNSPHAAAPFLMKNVGYDPLKDFAPVTRMGSYTLMLCVNPEIPATTVKELIAYARANPG